MGKKQLFYKEIPASKVENVINLLKEKKSFEDIQKELGMSSYECSDYIINAFKICPDLDPAGYVSKEDMRIINNEMELMRNVSRKELKNRLADKGHNYSYDVLNVVAGIYFRTDHFYNDKEVVNGDIQPVSIPVVSVEKDLGVVKTSLDSIPMFKAVIDSLKTAHWKAFATELFTHVCPKQFFIMPAAMQGNAHDIVELSFGEYEGDTPNVKKMGGKCFHSIRVCEIVEHILNTDAPEITDFYGIVKKYVYGNEYEDWESDMLKVAALSHDIYSGGVEDEFNYKRRYLDKNHPYYHRTELACISCILPENEWETYLTVVENHMWKWSPKECTVFFHDGKKKTTANSKDDFYNLYRLVKVMEIADYLAAQRDKTRGKEIIYAIKTYKTLYGTFDMPEDVKEKLGITEEELMKSFGHSDYNAIVQIIERVLS